MPQPNATNPFTIVITQRNSTGTYFQEQYVSGSNLRLETDANGNIVGVPGGGASGRFTGSFSGSAYLSSLTASAIRIIGKPTPLVFANNNSQTITKTGAGDFYITNTVSGGKVYVENSYFLENDLVVPGDITVTGDVAINGGDLTTTATNFNIATGASGQITIGGSSTKVYIPGTLRASVISESIIHITSSQVDIGDNIIRVNALYPFKKYAGLEAIDSGSSPRVTASVLWNSETNTWFINHQNSGIVTSSYIITGPKGSGFGNPKPLQSNVITKGTPGGLGNEITSSKLTDDGTTLTYTGTNVSFPAVTFTQLTGSDLRLTGGDIRFSQNTTIATDINTSGGSGYDINITAGTATGGAAIGGSVSLRPGKGVSASGSIHLYDKVEIGDNTVNQDTLTVYSRTNILGQLTGSDLRLTGGDIRFGATTTVTPDIVSSGEGYAVNIFGGTTTAATQVGGDVTLRGGRGTDGSGSVQILGGATIGGPGVDKNTLSIFATTTVSGQLTASKVRVTGPSVMVGNTTIGDTASDTLTVVAKSTFTAPITASSLRVTGIAELTASYTKTASIANKVVVTNNIVGTSDYYLTFVDGTAGNRTINVDSNKLVFVPKTNTLSVGPSQSGSIIVGDTILNANLVNISSLPNQEGGASIDIGTAIGNVSSSFRVGTTLGGNFFSVQTYKSLLTPNGVSTNLVFTSSNITQTTNWNNGAISTKGGVGVAKDLRVSGSIAGYTVITGSIKSNNFVFDDLKGNISNYVAGGSTNGRIPSSSLDRTISGKGGFSLVTGSLRVDDQFLYIFTGVYWKRVALQSFNI